MEYLIEGLNVLLLFFIIMITYIFHREDLISYQNPFSYIFIGITTLLIIDILFIFFHTPTLENSLRTLLRTGIFILTTYIFLFKYDLFSKRNF